MATKVARKVCLITGATSGIGLAAAKELIRDFDLILISRNPTKAASVVAELKKISEAATIDSYIADLSSLMSASRACELILENHNQIDVLINNAGVVIGENTITEEGIEKTFAINHLAAFLITQKLSPLLGVAASLNGEARVITVASEAHRTGDVDFANLEKRQSYNSYKVYADTKLMNILFTAELDHRLAAEGNYAICANCLHPGVVNTGFAKEKVGLFEKLFGLVRPFMSTPEQGAKTTIFLARSEEVAGKSGGYYSNCKLKTPSKKARSEELATKLWDRSEELIKEIL